MIYCYYCLKNILLNNNSNDICKNLYIGIKPYCLIHGYIKNRIFLYDFILYEKINEIMFINNFSDSNKSQFKFKDHYWFLKPNIYHNGISYIN
jgi:hypothetical protein